MKRLSAFIRSVIPADPFQLLFLGGVVCLIAAHGLRWWPPSTAFSESSDNFAQVVRYVGVLSVYLIIFSGMAGYFVCFWPGKYPVRRIVWLVCVPALLGIGLMFIRVLYLTGSPSSILDTTGSVFGHRLNWAASSFRRLPEGFHFALLGVLLIAVYASRMAFGIATLPLQLPGRLAAESEEGWRRLEVLIFVLVGPFFLVGSLLSSLTLNVPIMLFHRSWAYIQGVWLGLAIVLESLVSFGLLVFFVGREEKQTIKQSLRWPGSKNLLLAGVFALGIEALVSMGQYLVERAQWAPHGFGRFEPPRFADYFSFPDAWLFLALVAAVCEEIFFRGLLQARFIRRYGSYRGLFLVGIVWAASHFFSDFSFVHLTPMGVFEKLAFRLFMSVVLSFVLGWLTLRAGSVLPAALAHGLYNVFSFSSPRPAFPGESILRVGLWAVLAYLLFRYWPVRNMDSPEPVAEVPGLTPAV